ncbi:D-tyrosyl-tRNA(Tyr) deacylase [Amylolactobacillus amylotrophicus DSM 20534]|uniref:D-tyrosyl-tRNA(Tyr) deacylase n=3 Tax=Amylolactobacillus TaxID=2767876 RepID=A0A1L6XA41_9LACO|nr:MULTISPECIES: D-aminoacyl-tRNA deacylase [Amylolactobacillus]APT17839.1 D-tyrosyl-tRNA(Tyr) deacylase [Amylolactobacillus amylophilus DSM 20533 = JCM 1125]APT19258.1 D-tyrosyl-tRNA(Tyr) deacylase [Amylolactobacillus amylophilus DSM 20533 = JCM 1125]KRK38463.1 D-tyrosyl-tRNA(Tyr) deacylase [Amylolactobacillus amylotrophicus DSM 20534]KRM42894.1 D-tyrosyl-tRNA(Tyr) deacylase [Amylolactobacillus amylophilus DSM 20533 = JCM 1125]GED79759.1 D-aminoacyl-tRNA deacylase [Amylolactobacillus amylophi
MRIVVQRVTEASVTVAQNQIARIGKGFLLLVGIEQGDTLSLAHKFADKITKLRVFSDQNDKMNLALADVAGQILSVSQFTLLADTSHGNRPSFTQAMRPELAEPLFEQFNDRLRANGLLVQTGEFGADMQVNLHNDGPVTIIFEERVS